MAKWLANFLEKDLLPTTDNTDRLGREGDLSVMSVLQSKCLSKKGAKNAKNSPQCFTDNTDRLRMCEELSVLSVPTQGHFFENAENIPLQLTDKTDRFEGKANMSVMSDLVLDKDLILENFEERLAIAEFDGQQTTQQAHRIAYQYAFIAVLATLPWEDSATAIKENWFEERIKKTREWLTAQNLEVPQ